MGTQAAHNGSAAMRDLTVQGAESELAASFDGTGDALPVLLLHADLGNRDQWRSVFDLLAAERRVASFDRRGHGYSPVPASRHYDYTAEVDDIAAVADAAQFDRFVLVGHSGGGAAAFLFAQTNPQRVAGLLLEDPARSGSATPPDRQAAMLEQIRRNPKQEAIAFYTSLAGNDPQVVERVVADIESTPDETIVAMVAALGRFDPAGIDLRYSGPALAVVQSADSAPTLLHCLASYPHRVVADAGHWIHLAEPQRFQEILRQFLAEAEVHAPFAEALRS